ncbi:class I SAM-dependent methyltransferase [Nannocystis sp. ILAH1]|uniref:class I SAM-dependent methyltransferase n=1 Tax=Nannocystis sp. ILAH1 TaxID=2996789 RepID=UPI00226FE80C|nr:class I SAM-dependent methyltransferase [Nannocystis sp. ILAH1]MCY0988407.1 class I SAM-dependent methyltransferase [Nannocystis sp. ILAH1]
MTAATDAPTDAPTVEPVDSCPVCGARDARPLLPEVHRIGVVRCQGCDLVHATGHYAATYLSESYYGTRARQRQSPTQPSARDIDRKRRNVELYDRLSGGRLGHPRAGARALDIGCDTGLLLDVLRELGYRTEGIERSPAGAQAQTAGHEVHALDIEVTDLGLGRFDLITMTHVLEHLREPVRGLVWIRRHLAPGGLAVIEVPNWGDLLRPLWGRRFRPLELGDHISFFERATFTAALTRAGLEPEILWSAPQIGTSLAPSLLTAADLALELRRQLRPGPAAPTVAGVAGDRLQSSKQGRRWQRLAGPLVVRGLDNLDSALGPWLEGVFGAHCAWGANLVVVARAHAT